MRLSKSSLLVLVAVAAIGLSGRLHADPITLNNGLDNQSTVQAQASQDSDGGTSTTNNVNSLPFTTVTTATDTPSLSTVTPTLSTTALNFSFTQSIAQDDGSCQTFGQGDIFFKAGAGTTFSISGSMTLIGPDVEGELITTLKDVTTATTVYSYDNFTDTQFAEQVISNSVVPASISDGTNATLTLDSTGGSLTGSLNAGDTYEFTASEEMDNNVDPNLSGNVGISFAQAAGGSAVPLPMGATSGMALLIGLGTVLKLRRKMTAA